MTSPGLLGEGGGFGEEEGGGLGEEEGGGLGEEEGGGLGEGLFPQSVIRSQKDCNPLQVWPAPSVQAVTY